MQEKMYLLEVCCGSVDDAIEAERGGADRVELNSCIFFGGLTPTIGSIIESKKVLNIPVMVMIRPRGGGFCYTDEEMASMLIDVEFAINAGVDGIVFGILKENGTIDEKRCEQIIKKAKDIEIVFHRAIDVVPDLYRSLDILADLGVNRVLTTGQEPTLVEGLETIRQMVEYTKGKIEILPGGGKPNNVLETIKRTKCSQIHMAAFKTSYDRSAENRPEISFGFALWPPENRYELTNRKTVADVKNILLSKSGN